MRQISRPGRQSKAFHQMESSSYDSGRPTDNHVLDTVICPSEFMKKQLDTSPVLAKKTLMLHNFVTPPDTEEETGAWETIKKRLPERYVLYFGRFSEEKGVRTLLKVCKNMTNVSFAFAGTGPLTEEVSRVSNIPGLKQLPCQAVRQQFRDAAEG